MEQGGGQEAARSLRGCRNGRTWPPPTPGSIRTSAAEGVHTVTQASFVEGTWTTHSDSEVFASRALVRLAVAEPDIDIGNIETVLETLSTTCYFLSAEKNRYRFSLSPNLNKLLADRRVGASGSVVAAVLEGSRPLCVEMQALVVPTGAPMPRRVAQAFDGGRLAMLVAIAQQRAGVALAGLDVFASVAGGVRVAEPGADLALALALASASSGVPVAADTVVVGELGLGGEVRQVPQIGRRLAEAQRLGFSRAIVPASSPDVAGIRLQRVTDLEEAARATGLAP